MNHFYQSIVYTQNFSVIYRDLKSENIGFDSNDTLKIFDFGLSKELHAQDALDDGTYKLTGETGSMRYMSPEVYKSETYNISADIYSFGMVFWEILALEKPFEEYSTSMHKDLVIGKGYRPMCKETWGGEVNQVMTQSWKTDKFLRPTSTNNVETLKDIFSKLKKKRNKKLRNRKNPVLTRCPMKAKLNPNWDKD